MSSTRQLLLCLVTVVACLLTSCQSDRGVRYHNFPDAVTNINQVDPAYRKYFVDQQGRNYSADDQRKALAAAIRTSRTPVPAYVPRSAMASSKKSMRRRSSIRSSRYASVKRGKSVNRRRAVARNRSSASRGRKVATKRKATTRRSVAKRKATNRRRRG